MYMIAISQKEGWSDSQQDRKKSEVKKLKLFAVSVHLGNVFVPLTNIKQVLPTRLSLP